ncbi:TetR/AcrR family transcriptional regulator [Bradyrhizobium prioriisuperbiae]|uniref:TetR/AcrR family transcriptional regulator n=1 Tax=Bradyrhizobium prioriisuperbiae TaxID=2854389 RepID=UPI0028E579F3|nr:TetR/AcrR family transcriptional regulator [Bradyrhizobium prioritasuperba]
MGALPKHRSAIIEAAARLFRRQGYAATGINEIAEVAGAPKGSLYHYFPDGKDQIAEAAVRFAGARVFKTLEQLSSESPSAAALIKTYGRMLQGWMAQSKFRDGCPITTTLLETAPQSPELTAAGREAFDGWCGVIAAALMRDGFTKTEARKLAVLAISSIEGALILSRVQGNGQPIADVTEMLAKTLRARS